MRRRTTGSVTTAMSLQLPGALHSGSRLLALRGQDVRTLLRQTAAEPVGRALRGTAALPAHGRRTHQRGRPHRRFAAARPPRSRGRLRPRRNCGWHTEVPRRHRCVDVRQLRGFRCIHRAAHPDRRSGLLRVGFLERRNVAGHLRRLASHPRASWAPFSWTSARSRRCARAIRTIATPSRTTPPHRQDVCTR